jgi:hypothetical protein
MRLEAAGDRVQDVVAFLTREEAAELRDACDELIRHFDEPGRHVHVSASDYQTEITIGADLTAP